MNAITFTSEFRRFEILLKVLFSELVHILILKISSIRIELFLPRRQSAKMTINSLIDSIKIKLQLTKHNSVAQDE